MKKMRAGDFKARCLATMRVIKSTGEPVVVTKRGQPLVRVIPEASESEEIFGFMADEFEIVGDIEAPVVPLKDWKILKK